jgi:hypothetical protein
MVAKSIPNEWGNMNNARVKLVQLSGAKMAVY